jgi:hypothetical protein
MEESGLQSESGELSDCPGQEDVKTVRLPKSDVRPNDRDDRDDGTNRPYNLPDKKSACPLRDPQYDSSRASCSRGSWERSRNDINL